jgi:hypothetical protein
VLGGVEMFSVYCIGDLDVAVDGNAEDTGAVSE